MEEIEARGRYPVKMGIKTKPNSGRVTHFQDETSQTAFASPTEGGIAKKTRRQRMSGVSKKIIRKKA
ncbi:MAG: hypothetical protein KJ927_08360, partial [Candidatus Eisenbacteria bacterium]|nr:hypothetical protein [Candidatus Eisenbacteria bacterium]